MTREQRDILIVAQERMISLVYDYKNAKLAYYHWLFDVDDPVLSDHDRRIIDNTQDSIRALQQVLDETRVDE